MRAIDADAFKEYIRGACEEMSHVFKDGGKWAKQITEDFCMDIDEQPTIQPDIIYCHDCKYAHITYSGEVKYCDIWFPDEAHYIDTDNYCSFAERREE